MKRFDFKIALPRWFYGILVGLLLAAAQSRGLLTADQAAMVAGILAAWGVDVDAYRRAQK